MCFAFSGRLGALATADTSDTGAGAEPAGRDSGSRWDPDAGGREAETCTGGQMSSDLSQKLFKLVNFDKERYGKKELQIWVLKMLLL